MKLWKDMLLGGKYSPKETIILDGIPRTLPQVMPIEERFRVDAVIYINAPLEVTMQWSIGRGRFDDTEEIIKKRRKDYENKTLPVVLEMKRLHFDCFYEIDGSGTIEEVHNSILEKLV